MIKIKTNFDILLVINLIFFNTYLINKFKINVYFFDAYDSPAYFEFNLFPVFRMPLITGLYAAIQDYQKIVIFQYAFYLLASTFLMISLYFYFGKNVISIFSVFFTSIFLSSTVILEHNYKLTSEGLNNSAFIFFVASVLLAVKFKRILQINILFFSLIFLGGTKAVTAIVSIIIFLILIIKFYKQIGHNKYYILSTILFGFIIFYLFVSTFSSDYSKNYTTSSIINERLWLNNEWREQIIDSKFPIEARVVWLAYKNQNLGLPPDNAVIDNSEFKKWYLEQGGENFLITFMIKNIDYTLLGPFCLPCFSDQYSFKQTVLSGWSQGTDEIKENIELSEIIEHRTLFWPIEPQKAYLFLSIFFALLGFYLLSVYLNPKLIKNTDANFVVFVVLGFGMVYSLISWYFGSKSNDMNRHQLLMAIDLRIVSIFLATIVLMTVNIKKNKEAQ